MSEKTKRYQFPSVARLRSDLKTAKLKFEARAENELDYHAIADISEILDELDQELDKWNVAHLRVKPGENAKSAAARAATLV